jgi:hypothetical protein
MKRVLAAFAASFLCTLVACEKEKMPEPSAVTPSTAATPPGPSPASTAAVAPAAAPAAGALATADNIPVAADFEEDAEKSITKANYRAELDSLEAEIK